jgi:hypothetical protein
VSADEVESEASNDGHVLCAVPLSVSGEIVLELDIEDPVHAFDAPVSADGGDDAVDVERGGGDIGSGFAGCFASLFGGGVDLHQGGDAGEAWLAWIAAVRGDPIDFGGGDIAAGLYAPMALFDGGDGDGLSGRGGFEVVRAEDLKRIETGLSDNLVGGKTIQRGALDLTVSEFLGERLGGMLGIRQVEAAESESANPTPSASK